MSDASDAPLRDCSSENQLCDPWLRSIVYKTGPIGPIGPGTSFFAGFLGRFVGRSSLTAAQNRPTNRPILLGNRRLWADWAGFWQERGSGTSELPAPTAAPLRGSRHVTSVRELSPVRAKLAYAVGTHPDPLAEPESRRPALGGDASGSPGRGGRRGAGMGRTGMGRFRGEGDGMVGRTDGPI